MSCNGLGEDALERAIVLVFSRSLTIVVETAPRCGYHGARVRPGIFLRVETSLLCRPNLRAPWR